MFTVEAYLSQHPGHELEVDSTLLANAQVTVDKANQLLARFGEVRNMRSGWRPQAVNDATPNSAKSSKHITGQAIDIADDTRDLQNWCMENLEVLAELGLWMEHPIATPSWCHVQTVPPGSGSRVFFPNATYAERFKSAHSI